jgi:hypothetical protein
MTRDHLDELEALARLAEVLMTATVVDTPDRCHAMAQALAVRLKTLVDGVRLG